MTSQHAHPHAAFDHYPVLLQDLERIHGIEGLLATAAQIVRAEWVDFHWAGRIAERNLGSLESFDGNVAAYQRVMILGYFQGRHYVAICITDDARQIRWMARLQRFGSFEAAKRAFLAGS